eukprot:5935010-Pleurochrysis_carterae.AAC.1
MQNLLAANATLTAASTRRLRNNYTSMTIGSLSSPKRSTCWLRVLVLALCTLSDAASSPPVSQRGAREDPQPVVRPEVQLVEVHLEGQPDVTPAVHDEAHPHAHPRWQRAARAAAPLSIRLGSCSASCNTRADRDPAAARDARPLSKALLCNSPA